MFITRRNPHRTKRSRGRWLKRGTKQYPALLPMDEFHKRQLLRLKLGLPDEYIFKECDEGEEIIAESIVTGERMQWNGQYWEKYN
jgi:hypothetical protein